MKAQRRNAKNLGLIFVISGPSGSGKSTLLDKLLQEKELKNRFARSISCTTRPQRSNERDKKDYFFISDKEFRNRRREKKFLEWTRYLGYYYATAKEFVENQLKAGKHILLCLDIRGALRIKQLYPDNNVTIFLLPPSLEAVRERIAGRCPRTKKEEIQHRLRLARKEFAAARNYDYCIVNQELRSSLQEFKSIILKEIDA